MPSPFRVTEQGTRSDRGRILAGLALVVFLALAPTLYLLANGKAGRAPLLVRPTSYPTCVRSAEWMRPHHPMLLADWRDQVVREGRPGFVVLGGRRYEKSLSNGCLGCHESRARFCDVCHKWAGVVRPGGALGCWACHAEPRPETGRAPRVR